MDFLLKNIDLAILDNFCYEFIKDFEGKKQYIRKWQNKINSGELEKTTEESIQTTFINLIFKDVLDYDDFTNKEWNINIETKTFEDATKCDGALGFFSDGNLQKDVRVVIELKKFNTNLDVKQNRTIRKSTVEQAFEYAAKFSKDCKWIIVSDFAKIRIYHYPDNVNYQYFHILDLLKQTNGKENDIEFKKFVYLLYKQQLYIKNTDINNSIVLPSSERLFHYRTNELEEITNKFYIEYRTKREELYLNLHNDNKNLSKGDLLFYTQKILDRLLFIRFAFETRAIANNVLYDLKELLNYSYSFEENKIWKELNYIFKAFNNGHIYENKTIPKFNGELFITNNDFDNLIVKDIYLKGFIEILIRNDFSEALKIEVLGHIFEQSITDIEGFRKKQNIDAEDLQAHDNISQRKKDGIYYTPDYITEYIVNQTIGKYLEKKENEIFKELKIDYVSDIESDFLRWYIDNLFLTRKNICEIYSQYIDRYSKALKEIKILDPACGSGAFLTKAFDYLDKEYISLIEKQKQIIEFENKEHHLKIDKSVFDNKIWEYRRSIVTNNLFGVDINLQSVEIAKLSLWLKTANKTSSLADLSCNIKQGNSLISDKRVKHGFVWNDYFKEIMDNNGFDIIIGNPPYFSISSLPEKMQLELDKEGYINYAKTSDIYCIFIEKGIQLLKNDGIFAFITSNQWLQTQYGKVLQKYLVANTNPKILLNFGGTKIFHSATVDTCILITQKEQCKFELNACHFKNDFTIGSSIDEYFNRNNVLISNLDSEKWFIGDDKALLIKEKIKSKGTLLKDWNIEINYGIKTGYNEAFIIDEQTKNILLKQDVKNINIIKPVLRGRDVHKYHKTYADLYLINTHNGIRDIEYKGKEEEYKWKIKPISVEKDYPTIYKHLCKHETKLTKRDDKGYHWSNLRSCIYFEKFDTLKIIYPETTVRRSEFYLDNSGMYIDKTCFMITGENLKYLNGVLCSKLIEYYLETELRTLGKTSIQYSKQYMEKLPIPEITDDNREISKQIELLVDSIIVVKQSDSKANIIDLEKQINELVYKLYDIGETEQNIIEQSLNKK